MTDGPPNRAVAGAALPAMDDGWIAEYRRAAGLKALNPAWAKSEIVLGLTSAAIGLRLLGGGTTQCVLGGALTVLGLYLAMAGHRSHLYMAMNRQAAYLLFALGPYGRDQPGGAPGGDVWEDHDIGEDPPSDRRR